MSFQLNVPPSVVAKVAKTMDQEGGETTEPGKRREDWKKLKELEEARKAGTAPAMKDEEGKDINPHIPQYIMQAPWYFGSSTPTLRHQRPQDEKHPEFSRMNDWFKKGVKEGSVATKYRKGACDNCGALTHKKKDCLERPRKIGAKFTGSEIAPDEHLQPELSFDYDGKRDRWNGYNTDEHKKIFDDFQKMEEAKRTLKAQKLEDGVITQDNDDERMRDEDSGDEEDEDKYADDVDMPGQKFESKQRITVRNLRIREDTAKYLLNLDVNSAYYDPKTRSMRENPYKNTGKDAEELTYAGDNFVRWSGAAMGYAKQQIFAWEAYEKGAEVHLQADPTKLDLLAKEYGRKKEVFKDSVKQNILEKYGGEEHLEKPPEQLIMGQSEEYVEYSRHGTVLKGHEKAKVRSRYEEDVYINNHTTVWGSFWKDGKWGFKCCHSFIKESYCTGDAGRSAHEEAIPGIDEAGTSTSADHSALVPVQDPEPVTHITQPDDTPNMVSKSASDDSDSDAKRKERKRKKKREKKKKKKRKHRKKRRKQESSSSDSSSSDSDSEDEDAAREKRIKEAMKKEKERIKQVEKLLKMDERKRPYNSMFNEAEPTEEEMEAFRRTQVRSDDPMAQFADQYKLL